MRFADHEPATMFDTFLDRLSAAGRFYGITAYVAGPQRRGRLPTDP